MNLKFSRIIIWFAFLGCIIATFSMIHSFDINTVFSKEVVNAMTSTDILLFRLSTVLFFVFIGIGLFIELDYLHLKDKLPLLKSRKTLQHIVFWFIWLLIALILIAIPQSFASDPYKKALDDYNKQIVQKS